MIRSSVLLFVIFGLCLSCGPSKEEAEKLSRAREDSIRVATEKATTLRLTSISRLQDSIRQSEATIEAANNRLIVRRADLVASTDRLSTIKTYQFLRTAEQREQQIRDQMILIQNLEQEVKELAFRVEVERNRIMDFHSKIEALQKSL
ncbi:MAG TPA: hypothetical protein VFE50_07190 [Cyclobacteriaceae bacterium]|nr:hypothetical protein [Cyclobacteriaceae bacterium]